MRAPVGHPTSGVPRPTSPIAEALRILGLCVGAAVVYGVLHDLVTAHVCVEYFTKAHPPWFATERPVLLALAWGVAGTWYVGAVLAIPLWCGARLGPHPPASWRALVAPLAALLAVMAVAALAAGLVADALARAGTIAMPDWLVDEVLPQRHAPFLTVLGAHLASYAVGFLGGLVLPVVVWVRRSRTLDVGRRTPDVPA